MGNTRPEQPLQKISDYLCRNFPDFFADARFSGTPEYIVDAAKARALARKRLSPLAQGYLQGLFE